jgi:uncharacterized protein (TIGR03084 family)
MSLAETEDFLAETHTLGALVNGLAQADFALATQFKNWTVGDVLVHLHFWNLAMDLAAGDEPGFQRFVAQVVAAAARGGLRAHENATIPERGPELAALWLSHAEAMAARWRKIDPKQRVAWIGPSMSARSAMTARQMETWAHGFEVFDLFAVERLESDRLRNLVVLGVNTFGWSHQAHRLPVPPVMPEVRLTAPSGALWTFGEASVGRVGGEARDFVAVVTQTRSLADTGLQIEGEVARTWMTHAQCFAGPPEMPPAPGSRGRRTKRD